MFTTRGLPPAFLLPAWSEAALDSLCQVGFPNLLNLDDYSTRKGSRTLATGPRYKLPRPSTRYDLAKWRTRGRGSTFSQGMRPLQYAQGQLQHRSRYSTRSTREDAAEGKKTEIWSEEPRARSAVKHKRRILTEAELSLRLPKLRRIHDPEVWEKNKRRRRMNRDEAIRSQIEKIEARLSNLKNALDGRKNPQEELRKEKELREEGDTKLQKSDAQLSLLEQLFPEEAEKWKSRQPLGKYEKDIVPRPDPGRETLRLNLPPLRRDEHSLQQPPEQPLKHSPEQTQEKQPQEQLQDAPPQMQGTNPPAEPEAELYREHDLTVMALSGLSTGLSNADFQRIIPRGRHIQEWRGPGDILKVIPLRNPLTLEQRRGYLLVFANPAYARAYKTRLERLHALTRRRYNYSRGTPGEASPSLSSSVALEMGKKKEDPLVLQSKDDVEKENESDLRKALADYTLCPPTQELSCTILLPPYRHAVKRILAAGGYEQFSKRRLSPGQNGTKHGLEDATLRTVLVEVANHAPSWSAMKTWLNLDGVRRGRAWTAMSARDGLQRLSQVMWQNDGGKKNKETLSSESDEEEDDGDGYGDDNDDDGIRGPEEIEEGAGEDPYRRWLLVFEDEPEARRFVRAWHMRPWPMEELRDVDDRREVAPVVSARLLW